MTNGVKKVAAINDLSGFGRASLCAIIPTMSVMGIQVCPLPTAVLSNHTGGFENYSFLDLTDYMEDYINHWKQLGLTFDSIYSGFLGSPRQIALVEDFIEHFGNGDTLTLVDPVMGDNGALYSSMTLEIIPEMRKLVSKANVITPNFTEACFLLDIPCRKDVGGKELKDWLRALSAMGPEIVAITSVPVEADSQNTYVAAYDRKNETFWKVGCRYIPAAYPGTGDIFASVFLGSLLQGDCLPVALDRAVQFVSQCVKATYGSACPKRNGVVLEKELGILNMPVIISGYEGL